jgi:hypothetical protein
MSIAKLSHDLDKAVNEIHGALVLGSKLGSGSDLLRNVAEEIAAERDLHGETDELTAFKARTLELAGTLKQVSELAAARAAELAAIAGQQ